MGYVLVEPPDSEPLTLAQAKAHLNVESGDFDLTITALITAARQTVEKLTRRSLMQQTWRAEFGYFPSAGQPLRLAHGPVSAVSSVTYIDLAGAVQTLDPALYVTDLSRDIPRIYPAPYQCWPRALCQPAAVKVTYVAGYGEDRDAVENGILQAILLLIGHWWANREAVTLANVAAQELPLGVDALVDLYRIPNLA